MEVGSAYSTVSLSQGPSGDEELDPLETIGAEDEEFERSEHRAALAPALERLPSREREILRMRFEEGLPQTQIAQRNIDDAGVADRVEIRVGPAADSLRAMPEEPSFDLAFIDADKPGYPDYYELVLPRLRPGGLMLLDNMLQHGRVLDPGTESARLIDELNRRIHDDPRVDMALVLVSDGVTFARKRESD